MARTTHRYTAYGLDIASDLELPELVSADERADGQEADLRIRLGETPERIEDPAESRVVWSARPGEWLQTINNVARYYVHDGGRELVVERLGGTDADLRAFLFGTALGAVLHQRGQFVLHASAVVLAGGHAVAVAGTAGAGKSTTLAALIGRGHRVLTDDKTAVRFGAGGPEVLPGYPTLRLWRDAVQRIGADPGDLPALREGMEKYLYRAEAFRHEPAPMRALVVLGARAGRGGPEEVESPAEPPEIVSTRVHGHQAVRTVLRQTYRRRIVSGSGLQAEHFQWAARLANAVSVVSIVRPRHGETVDAVADAVEAAVEAAAETAAEAPTV
ncbi:hypothetical protein [Rubrivirga sp.]|uniref:hypothetical protein n=1 Tax=Rubrivirga sp. TaxID=1885344 RepID=UPI003B51D4E1